MSAYTTQAAVQAEIGLAQLIATTDDGQTGDVDQTILASVIANASDYIDGELANTYSVPFGPVPTAISSLCLTIVCYRLFKRRSTPDQNNFYYEDWKTVQRRLTALKKGEEFLDATTARSFTPGAAITIDTVWNDNTL